MLGIAVSANSDLSCGVNRSELAQKDGIYQKDVYSRPCCNREHCGKFFTLRQHMRNFSGESLSRVAWTFTKASVFGSAGFNMAPTTSPVEDLVKLLGHRFASTCFKRANPA